MSFKIVRNDIVKMNTEAIVNTASSEPVVGAGCDFAVYTAAGYDELLEYRNKEIGVVEEGDAFITPGFNLLAKYIIHAVSPLYENGSEEEEKKLRSCYQKCLELAKEHQIKSIAFPLISTGSFMYPKEDGMRIALDEISEFLLHNDMEIYIVVFDSKTTKLGTAIYSDLKSYIDENYVEDKNRIEYGDGFVGSTQIDGEIFDVYEDEEQSDEAIERMSRPMSINARPENITKKNKKKDFNEQCEARVCIPNSSSSFFDDYEENLEELKKKLDDKKAHLADSFSEYLMFLIERQGLNNVDVYKTAYIDKKLFAKIKNDPKYHPQKITCLCLCVGARLNLDDTRDLLARAGYALSPADMRDVIFSYFIENRIYDIIEIDIQLEEYGIPCIIAS